MDYSSMVYKKKAPLLLFLIPAFLLMTVFLFYPFVMNIFNSFSDIRGLGQAPQGLNNPWYGNYQSMLYDQNIHTALENTLLLLLCTIVFQVGLALVLAMLVDGITKGAEFFRTLYFFPIVISATALGLLFNLIFLYNGGMLNQLLANLGLVGKNLDWKGEGLWRFTMFAPVMWQYVGFYFVIIVTGLNNISGDIYEAAEVDGATALQRVFYIKLPLLHNVLATCLTLAITGSLKVFDLPWTMMPNGMPVDKSWLTGTYMYKQTFLSGNVDYGSAIAVLIVVLGVTISGLAGSVLKEKDY